MRGVLVAWDDSRGFGFVETPDQVQHLFVHVKFLRSRHVRPAVGDTVLFTMATGRNGRPSAEDVEIVGAPPPPEPAAALQNAAPAPRYTAPRLAAIDVTRLLAAISILLGVAALWYTGRAPAWFCALYYIMGIVSAGLYFGDKHYAIGGRSRVRETSLHLADALFGIGGGLFAQHVFRHKIRKRSFRYMTRLIYIAHATLVMLLLSGIVRL